MEESNIRLSLSLAMPAHAFLFQCGRNRSDTEVGIYSGSVDENSVGLKREMDDESWQILQTRSTEGMEREIEASGGRAVSDEEGDAARKKLRLTKGQSALLEASFKEHTTLNTKQKSELARKLNLRPRQVEVWFQNRRARTKLKQTEFDCEYLKRCCENLTEENQRLERELVELRALKMSPHFYKQMPATTLTLCPSCGKSEGPAITPVSIR